MSKRKKREENLRRRVAAIAKSLEKDNKEKINKKHHVTAKCVHVWNKFCESEDHTEIEYYCDNCHVHKTEKQTFEHYKFKLLPHELKNHGPAEHHLDPRKYTAPLESIRLRGDLIQRNKIFNNCFRSKVITNVNVTGLEEKSEILDTLIPKIIVDECVTSLKLLEKIQEIGYNVEYLGRGLPDEEIFKTVEEQNAVLVTEDKEFHDKVLHNKPTHDPIFVSRNTEKVLENVDVIQRYMKRFEANK